MRTWLFLATVGLASCDRSPSPAPSSAASSSAARIASASASASAPASAAPSASTAAIDAAAFPPLAIAGTPCLRPPGDNMVLRVATCSQDGFTQLGGVAMLILGGKQGMFGRLGKPGRF